MRYYIRSKFVNRIYSFLLFLSLFIQIIPLFSISQVKAANSPWTQTDWAGETGTGVDTSTDTSQVTLANSEELSNVGFETDLTNWNASDYSANLQNTESSNLIAYYPLNESSGNSTQAINPALSEGRNQLVDGDMERADTSAYTAGSAAVLTKQTTSPHGGSRLLRIADGGSSNPQAYQNCLLSAGKTYRFHGFARSNGVALPRIYHVTSGGIVWEGTTSTNWQEFDLNLTIPPGSINLVRVVLMVGLIGGSGNYAEYDDITITQVNIAASTSYPGSALLSDGNMEITDASAWTVVNSATLSKQTTLPHGGSRLLRVSYNSVSNPSASQSILTVGKRYKVTGYARSDGSSTPLVKHGTDTIIWTGTTSTNWQYFNFEATAAAVNFLFGPNISAAGYAEYDDISVTEVNPFNGTNSNLTQGVTGIGDGNTAYSYNGSTSYTNIYSPEINSAFNPNTGTILAWAKVSGSGVWIDSTARRLISIYCDANNQIYIDKSTASNRIDISLIAGGTTKIITDTSLAGSTNYFMIAMTWDISDGLIMYINGSQVGLKQTGLGTWAGNLSTTRQIIGASSTTPANIWSGSIAHVALWNATLTPTEISALYDNVAVTSRNTATTHGGSVGAAEVIAATDSTFTQTVNVGNTNSYNFSAYAYTDGSAVTNSDAELYYNGSTIATTYTAVGGGWYRLNGTLTGAASARDYGVEIKAGRTVYLDDFSLNSHTSSGTLNSQVFDTEFSAGAIWEILTYSTTIPINTTVSIRARTSNSITMTGAPDFSTCNPITSGTDISSNNCITDSHQYIQYQINLSTTDTTISPTFEDISIEFSNYDSSPPIISLSPITPDPTTDNTPTLSGTASDVVGTIVYVQYQIDTVSGIWNNCVATDGSFNESIEGFTCTPSSALADGSHTMYIRAMDQYGNITASGGEPSDTFTISSISTSSISYNSYVYLDQPDNNIYTNNDRPVFRWRGTTDSPDGLDSYSFSINNPSLGYGYPSGDFSINNIPTIRTRDYSNNKYTINYENFANLYSNDDYITLQTNSSSDWGSYANDGKLREGRITWAVSAYDNIGNATSNSHTIFLDQHEPIVTFSEIGDKIIASEDTLPLEISTTNQTFVIEGRITDYLYGGDSSQLQTKYGPKIASGPKSISIETEKKETAGYRSLGTYNIEFDALYYTCDNELILDNTLQECDKYSSFLYESEENLEPGEYRVTVTGEDIAGNETKTTFNLTIQATQKVSEYSSSKASTGDNFFIRILKEIGDSLKTFFKGISNNILAFSDESAKFYQKLALKYKAFSQKTPETLGKILIALWDQSDTNKNTIQNVLSEVVFAIGRSAENTSYVIGDSFITIGYAFIPEPTTIYDVQVETLSPTSAKISWKTNHPASAKINYGLDKTYSNELQTADRDTYHEFVLTDLEPNTEYHFEVMSQNKTYVYDADRSFYTLSETEE